jgi:hypothetical protein
VTQARLSETESGARPQVNLTNLCNLACPLGGHADYRIRTWEDEVALAPTVYFHWVAYE